ncbi:TlpA disulfide reductase family protein [Paracnuella aquatica]|uniref:TlpA disulfide reductase family protein n=1 Tax=Paracnuella aquatica TaxID=2268757 RepID=UPI000DEEC4F4|nr:TlpA disulfide reductase family protein [Paracnuella aquatica]RPD44485.1 AhpC/TSA family protein [Paracnuella aquatica]
MRYYLLAILITGVIKSYGQNGAVDKPGAFSISGKLVNRDTGIIVLWYPNTAGVFIKDTSYLKDGYFNFKGEICEPSFAHFIGSNRPGNYADFFLEVGEQQVLIEENKFSDLKFEGSNTQKENDVLNMELRELDQLAELIAEEHKKLKGNAADSLDTNKQNKMHELEKKLVAVGTKKKQLRMEFIKRHPDSYVSPTELLTIMNSIYTNEAITLYSTLTDKIKKSRAGKLCAIEIANRQKLLAGNPFPDFTTIDIEGKNFSLTNQKGKYVLVDFWASWCLPCRKAVPQLKEIHARYAERGFNIIGISTDKDKNQWLNAVKADQVGAWINIHAADSLRELFTAVQVLPTQFLLDPYGKIIWSSLEKNNESLEQVLASRLN